VEPLPEPVEEESVPVPVPVEEPELVPVEPVPLDVPEGSELPGSGPEPMLLLLPGMVELPEVPLVEDEPEVLSLLLGLVVEEPLLP
jgi:hypothetical protein